VYDGSVNILSGVLGTNALVGTETLNVSGTGTVASKSVGASKPLTLGTLALADGANGGLATNYTVTGGTHTASVTAAALTLSTSAVSKTYDGNLTAVGTAVVNSGTLFTGDTLSGGTFAFTDKNVGLGNKTVTAAGVTVSDGNSGSNYTVSYASNSASTINPFVVSLSGTRVYDGSVNILAGILGTNALIGTETLSLTGTGTVATKNVGASKPLTLGTLALADGSNGGLATNYTVTGGTHTASVTAAALTLSTSAVSKTYDGNLSALGTAIVNSGTLFTGDTISGGTFAFTDKNVGAGSKTVTATDVTVNDGNSGSNYTVSYASNTASTINPYVVNLSGTRAYDGSTNILAGVLGTNALVGTETLSLTGTGTVATKNVGAGKTLTLGSLALADGTNGGLASNYTVTGGTHTASVTAAALTLSTSAVSKIYDGNLTAVGTAVVNSGTLFTGDTISGGTFAFTDKNVGAGNKTVTAAGVTVSDGNSGSNYTVSYASNTASTINPYVVNISGTRAYDGSANILAGMLGTNTLVGTETLNVSGTGTVASKNVGAGKTLTLGSLALGNGANGGLATNYTVTGGTHTAGITAAALTLSTNAVSKTYDGNLSALGSAVVNSGTLFTGDTLSGGTFAFTDKNVGLGNKTVTAAGVTVNDGNSGSNYTVSYASNTASTINPYVVNLSGTRVYDGTVNILAGILSTNALVGTETVSVSGTGTVTSKNLGASKPLTLGTLALGDGSNGGLATNYTVTGGTHTAGITAAALTLSTSAVSKTYDGNLSALGTAIVNSGTLFTGDSLSGGTFAFTDKNVGLGNKTVTATGVTVNDGNSGSNYTVSYASNTASTINPFVVSLTGSRAYDGSLNILAGALSTGTLVGTETLSLSGTGTVASKNVGASKPLTLGTLALADGSNGGLATNYTVTGGTHTAGITAAALTLSTSAVSKTYDSNLSALGTAVVNSGTLFTGDSLSGGTFAFTDKNVGAGNKTVTAAGVTISDGNSGGNYTVSYASNTASTINPFVVNLGGTRVYDGSTSILSGILGTNALVGTETLSVSGTGTVASKNVGASKPLTLGTLALADGSNGGLATNYTVTGGTHTASVTAAPLTLSTSAVSKTYDGNLSALGSAIVNSGTLFTGDTLSGGTFAFTDKNVGLGNKTVTAAGVTVSDGNSGSNYTVSYASNTASTINPFVVNLSGTRVYDGSVNILAGILGTNALVGTETLNVSGTGTVASKNVGAGKTLTLGSLALVDGSNGGLATNYTVTGGTHTASVTAAALTLSTSAVSKTYDGNLSALGTAIVNSGTLFTGDTLSGGTFAFTDKNVGAGNKTVTAAGVTVSDGNSGGNYTVSYASNTASTINPYVVNLSGTRVYDSSVTILASELRTNTLVGTETLSLSGTGTVANKNVGASKPLTLGTLALGNGTNGGLASNYTLTSGTHSVGITQALLNIAANAGVKVYDGLAWSGGNGVTYTGFKGSDTAADLTGTLVYGGNSQGATNVGNYNLVPSGQSSANYATTYVNGNLGITRAPLGIAA
ncbi:MAG: YDG domain-containing protein, partial [Gammaproteobacteria bacterium]|nr:YDG domain-containing protein [Gammaproteobacteria bacterium]